MKVEIIDLFQNRQDILVQLQKVVTGIALLPPLSMRKSKLMDCLDKVNWCKLVDKIFAGIDRQELKKSSARAKNNFKN